LWRPPLAITLIVLGSVLAPVAVVGFWASNEVTNTDRYVQNMAPLISEPAVQAALTGKISDAITGRLDIQAQTASAAAELSQHGMPRLSTALQGLSGPIASAADGFVHTVVGRSVASPAMAAIWTQANRTAHAAIVKVLSGQGNGAITADANGTVTISLGPFIDQAKRDLAARGFSLVSKIPPVNPTFTLFTAPNLKKAQAGYRLVDTLHWVLPFVSLGLIVAGIFVARRRRRAVTGAGLGMAVSMVVLAVALAIAREIYLRSVPASALPADAAAVLYDDLVRFIREGLRVLIVVGLVVAGGAYLGGQSRGAVWVRRTAAGWIAWLGARGPRTGPVGTFAGAHKTGLRVCVIALAALIFVFSIPPTLTLVIWLLVVLLILLGLIELLGGPGRRPASPATAPPAPRNPA
jgi:hypothetical protein